VSSGKDDEGIGLRRRSEEGSYKSREEMWCRGGHI